MDVRIMDYASPCGTLTLGAYGDRLCLCDWRGGNDSVVARRLRKSLGAGFVREESEVTLKAKAELEEYFACERKSFDLPLLFVGTDFQRLVWNELMAVPFGATVSYAEIARRIGKPESVRAAANANGANAISIFVPCHRVIGANHSLTGYAGGLNAKRFLLDLEESQV